MQKRYAGIKELRNNGIHRHNINWDSCIFKVLVLHSIIKRRLIGFANLLNKVIPALKLI